jgi:hypothetical protein
MINLASLLVRTGAMIIDQAFDGLRKINVGLAQSLRASDFGTGLLNRLIGQIDGLLNRRFERLHVLFSHEPGLLAQWGQSLAITDLGSLGGYTLTANTIPYSSMKNLAPRKINGLGCAKTDLVWQLNGYTQ